jgi:hypothetical protein
VVRRETSDTGRQLRTRPTTPRRRGQLITSDPLRESLWGARGAADDTGKLGPRRQARPTWGLAIAPRAARRADQCDGRASTQRGLRSVAPSATGRQRPRDPGTRRPTGARVNGRLQRSTRSIFHVPREASREASRSRDGVASQGRSPEDRVRGLRNANGCTMRIARTIRDREPRHRSQDRVESKEGVLGSRCHCV